MKRVPAMVVTACFLFSAIASYAAETKPRLLTAVQAEVRAREFCKKVGWAPAGKPKYKLEEGWGDQGAWDVDFPERGRKDNEVRVSVDRLSGIVRYAVSDSAGDRLELSNKVTLTDKQAEEAAVKFLKIAGGSLDDAKLDGVTRESNTYPESDLRLEVNYSRYYKGIQFADDSAGAAVNPRDGSLVRLWYTFGTPPPEKTIPAVDKDTAVKTATEYIKDKRKIDGLKSAELLIVEPDSFMEERKPKDSNPRGSCLAWWITFSWDRYHEADVVVDAETGKVLYWDSCM